MIDHHQIDFRDATTLSGTYVHLARGAKPKTLCGKEYINKDTAPTPAFVLLEDGHLDDLYCKKCVKIAEKLLDLAGVHRYHTD